MVQNLNRSSMSQINFEISLFLLVILSSGIFYLPINRWEYRISERNRQAVEKKIKYRNQKIKALKKLKRTSNKLTLALTS